MKLIDQYHKRQQELEAKIKDKPTGNLVLELQELNYRINVLDSIRILNSSAPITKNVNELLGHFQLTSGYLQMLIMEHRFGARADESLKKKRETASQTIQQVFDDGCKRFANFKPESEEQYLKIVSNFIIAMLNVWISFRNTFTEIKDSTDTESNTAELSFEERYQNALKVICPLEKYKGKTLGELMGSDPKLINWLATKYSGEKKVIAAALTICEYAEKNAA